MSASRPAALPVALSSLVACPGDDDDLDAYVKEVVDNLPPLTDEQRDLLALIFRSNPCE
ncbi:MAG TPA: hypothetical protein VMV92_21530 [Streptosporangiaceae bacterium]|nr:hypothetical protein [Streptosporangiaceae bacterium]